MSEEQKGDVWTERSWVGQWLHDARKRFYVPHEKLENIECATVQELEAHLKIFKPEKGEDAVGEPYMSFKEPARHRAGTDYAGYAVYSAPLLRKPLSIPLVCHAEHVTFTAAPLKVDIAYQCGSCKGIRFSPPLFVKHESNGIWLPFEGLEYVCWMCNQPMYLRVLKHNEPSLVGKPTEHES